MAGKSKIEWTGHTWNPIAGCSILTPGCTNCYAMKMAARLEAMGQELYAGLTKPSKAGPVWTGMMRPAPESVLLAPLRRKKPTTYFVNSMSDLFHEDCPDEWIDKVFAVMALCPQHTFQVLTKRAERMREYLSDEGTPERIADAAYEIWATNLAPRHMGHLTVTRFGEDDSKMHIAWPLPNVWLGVSTERQKEADERIPLLLQTPAAVRFISAEPLLGPIDLMEVIPNPIIYNAAHGMERLLDWVIVGGESGHDARPMHPDWARKLRDQCAATGTHFFFKQWGMWAPDAGYTGDGSGPDLIFEGKGPCAKFVDGRWEFSENGFTMPLGGDHEWMYRLGKKTAGRLLDGITHDAMPSPPDHGITPPARRAEKVTP